MAKRKGPVLPTLKDLTALVKDVQNQLKADPGYYYNDEADGDLLSNAQEALYERMMNDYVDSAHNDPAFYAELTEDLPGGRDSYSDYDLDNYVTQTMEESFKLDHGEPDSLDPQQYWDDLVKEEPDLIDCCFITLTVGANGKSKRFNYQTGDNSYTGGAYGYPYWAVLDIGIKGKPSDYAREIQDQISELWYSGGGDE